MTDGEEEEWKYGLSKKADCGARNKSEVERDRPRLQWQTRLREGGPTRNPETRAEALQASVPPLCREKAFVADCTAGARRGRQRRNGEPCARSHEPARHNRGGVQEADRGRS